MCVVYAYVLNACVRVCPYMCIRACTFAYMCVYACACIYMYMCMYVSMCMCMYECNKSRKATRRGERE